MCGIVGVFHRSTSAPVDGDLLRRMRDTIAYRGPDAAGEFIDGRIGFGFRRLAIIDLASGMQPMSSPDGRYTIVFNGEIYNYRELKRPLEASVRFRTRSDTEVLLAHLATHGPEGLSAVNGMFAFALWDKEREELLLGRDRFGKKPLYIAEAGGQFFFASEPKALLARPEIHRDLDAIGLTQYFLFEYVPSPRTPFQAIQRLPAGHWLRVTRTESRCVSWWRIPTPEKESASPPAHAVRTFDELLGKAVLDRMVADVPVGVLLSGGIDSTTIAWYMRQHTSSLHSFSASFTEPTFDESAFAARAAAALGTTHHDIRVTPEVALNVIDVFRETADEPFGDASFLPTYAVSKEARRTVTVVLDGDGADELLFGYNTFQAFHLSLFLERLPPFVIRALEAFAARLPTRYTDFSFDFKAKALLRGLQFPRIHRNQVWIGSFHATELAHLLTKPWQQHLRELTEPISQLQESLPSKLHPLTRLSLVYLMHYLQDDILVKIDRATMYNSLEARTPYLDPRLVAFILRLPRALRYRRFKGKPILREVMRGRIPEEILKRPKKGFSIPLGHWLRGPLKSLLLETLSEDRLRATGVVRPEAALSLIEEHLGGRADHRKKLWTLMAFQWWFENWGGKP